MRIGTRQALLRARSEEESALRVVADRRDGIGLVTEPGCRSLERQRNAPTQQRGSLQAEKRLIVAVLEDAISQYLRYSRSTNPRGRRLFAEVDQWFTATDVAWPFSFSNLCQALDVDPTRVRLAIRRAVLNVGPSDPAEQGRRTPPHQEDR